MTSHTAVLVNVDTGRWRDWQVRGAARDQRTSARMRKVLLIVVATLMVWFVFAFTDMK